MFSTNENFLLIPNLKIENNIAKKDSMYKLFKNKKKIQINIYRKYKRSIYNRKTQIHILNSKRN